MPEFHLVEYREPSTPAPSTKRIRALQRGIAVMRSLEGGRAVSLEDLHGSTRIPKPTLLRILRTLEDERLAARRIVDGKWLSGPGSGSLRPECSADARLIQAATPELANLCAGIIWPSDLSVRQGLHMRLVETSRPQATLVFNRLAVGFKIDFLMSAPGRAYLAFCPEAERDDVLERLSVFPEYGFLFERGRIRTILEQTRQNGFAHREALWGGKSRLFRKSHDDGLDAIAVPVQQKDKIIGCVNIVWIRSILAVRDIVSRHLDDLQRTSQAIAAAFERDLSAAGRGRKRE